MKTKSLLGLLILILIMSSLITACNTSTSSTTTQSTVATTQSSTANNQSTTKTTQPSTTTSVTTTKTATASNWWSTFGEPQYGGKITIITDANMMGAFDNTSMVQAEKQYWLESLWSPLDWTLDRNTWSYRIGFTPEKYYVGNLVKSWEWTDPTTLTVHVREGIHWQNKAPVNGREFIASDIQSHYDRLMGTGSGFTESVALYKSFKPANLEKVTATDKYTAVFKFSAPSGSALASLMDPYAFNAIEAPEWVAQGDLKNWQTVVGTGPWMLTDYQTGNSMTLTKNTSYWNYDERYPTNQLPYSDELKILIMSDLSTKLAALRTAKIDIVSGIDWQQAASLAKTSSELIQVKLPPQGATTAVGLRNDKAPFTDIRVRKALQMSLDLKSIATGYFGGTADGTPCGLVSPTMTGYAYAYNDWPQSLKDEYSYNLTAAKQLMSEAGYPNGFKTNVVVATGMYDSGLMQVIKAQFSEIGVDMEIVAMDPPTENAYVGAGKHDQMVQWWSAFSTQTPSALINRYATKANLNWNHVNDSNYDALVNEFNAATDSEEIAKIMTKADKYALEQHFVVNLFETSAYNIYQPYLKGYSGEARLGWGGGYLYARLFVDQTLKK